ncbi:hypothetical protein JTE90_028141 [Oedothorax gibbosus]|uniref:Uncharacterized protein n=1 Tax=Oedothorax gibbosus TaxID=931172 RepID=A0AAV6VBE1_9ARAC|nr:hypothetical protein JTE90_028141 [Oedothorax gibbosus]
MNEIIIAFTQQTVGLRNDTTSNTVNYDLRHVPKKKSWLNLGKPPMSSSTPNAKAVRMEVKSNRNVWRRKKE